MGALDDFRDPRELVLEKLRRQEKVLGIVIVVLFLFNVGTIAFYDMIFRVSMEQLLLDQIGLVFAIFGIGGVAAALLSIFPYNRLSYPQKFRPAFYLCSALVAGLIAVVTFIMITEKL